jgi:hypothetical protein
MILEVFARYRPKPFLEQAARRLEAAIKLSYVGYVEVRVAVDYYWLRWRWMVKASLTNSL